MGCKSSTAKPGFTKALGPTEQEKRRLPSPVLRPAETTSKVPTYGPTKEKVVESWKVATFHLWNRPYEAYDLSTTLSAVAPFLVIRHIQIRMHKDVFHPTKNVADDVCEALRVLCTTTVECPEALSLCTSYLEAPEVLHDHEIPSILDDIFLEMFKQDDGRSAKSAKIDTLGVIFRGLQAQLSVPAEHHLYNRLHICAPELKSAQFEEGKEPPQFTVTMNKATQHIRIEHTKNVRVVFPDQSTDEKLTFSWCLHLDFPSSTETGQVKFALGGVKLSVIDVFCDPTHTTTRALAAVSAISALNDSMKTSAEPE